MNILRISTYLLDKKIKAMHPRLRARHYYWTRANIRPLTQDETRWLAKYEKGE